MPTLYLPSPKKATRRPESFTLDYEHPLLRGCVFAGLGRYSKTTHYHDSSLYRNNGTLTGMDPTTDWAWDGYINRPVLNVDGTGTVNFPLFQIPRSQGTYVQWLKCQNAPGASTYLLPFRAIYNDNYPTFDIVIWNGNTYLGWWTWGAEYRLVVAASSLGIAANQWVSFAYTWIAGQLEVFINGVSKGAQTRAEYTWDTTQAGTVIRIGQASYEPFSSADVLIYDHILSTYELSRLADPSNVLLDGAIVPNKKFFTYGAAAPPVTTNRRRRFLALNRR